MTIEERIKNEYNSLIDKLFSLYLEAINEEREKGKNLYPVELYLNIRNRIATLEKLTEINLFDDSNLMERIFNEIEVEFTNAVNEIKEIRDFALSTNDMIYIADKYEEINLWLERLTDDYELIKLLLNAALDKPKILSIKKKGC